MEKARVKENKTRGPSLFLSLSLDASVFRVVRFFVLARSRFSAAVSKRVLYSSVLHFSPVVFSQLFFFSHKFRVFESFPGTFGSGFRNDILSAFFRTPPSRERERERGRHEDSLENAVRRALETFSGALFSFVAFDHPLGLVFSKWISFVSSLLLIRFFQSRFRNPKRL